MNDNTNDARRSQDDRCSQR